MLNKTWDIIFFVHFFSFTMALCVRFRRTHSNGCIPTKAHDSDAGFDLYAATMHIEPEDQNLVIDFGIALEIPPGHVGLLFPRSSIASKKLFMRNSVGVIDSGYRGSITAKFGTYNTQHFMKDEFRVGDRAAQLIIIPLPEVQFTDVAALADSDRSGNGYGSSGL